MAKKTSADSSGSRYMQKVHEETLGRNLRQIDRITGARSYAEVCRECGLDESTYNRYVNGNSPVKLEVIMAICEEYGFTIDDFIYQDLSAKEQEHRRDPIDPSQFEGAYLVCFRETISGKLKYGVLCICRDGLIDSSKNTQPPDMAARSSRLRAIAVFCDRQEAQTKLAVVEEIFSKEKYSYKMLNEALGPDSKSTKEREEGVKSTKGGRDGRFFGSVLIDTSIITILLHSDYYSDDVMIKLYKSNPKHKYVGGVGLVISNVAIPPGKGNRMPCAQKMILARPALSVDEAYLDDALSIDTNSSAAKIEADWISLAKRVSAMIDTVSRGAEKSGFTEEDIITIIAGILQNACRQHMNANPLPFVVLSPDDDKKGYAIIKLSIKESKLQ